MLCFSSQQYAVQVCNNYELRHAERVLNINANSYSAGLQMQSLSRTFAAYMRNKLARNKPQTNS